KTDTRNIIDRDILLGCFSFSYVVLSGILMGLWMGGTRWGSLNPSVRPWEMFFIPAVCTGITGIVSGICFSLRNNHPFFKYLLKPVNILIVWGQLFDGTATWRGIDGYGYREKHPIPALLIELTGTGAVMFLLKMLLLAFVFYIFYTVEKGAMSKRGSDEGVSKKPYESKENIEPILFTLIKLSVLVLGLAPGLRDTFRLVMGV
ncbi:MAG: DUF63 family protein, partial [Thermoplasmata archaeon]